MNFNELPEFTKECKRLAKKYKSLPNDLQEFRKVVSVEPLGNSKHFNIVTQIESTKIVKARLFCRYLKGLSLRVIYAYTEEQKRIEFIQLYFKGDREVEDRKRMNQYLKSLNS